MIELAVFGTGRIGQVHARNLAAAPGVRLRYLVDPIASPARDELAVRTGTRVVDADAVFADPDVAGVVIASSTDTHAGLLLDAEAARKAVFCKKPISLDFPAVAMVEASGLPAMLGFQRRYDRARGATAGRGRARFHRHGPARDADPDWQP